MRRGLPQDYANTVCQIFTGWRLLVSPGDLPLLLEMGEGQLQLDLLDGSALLGGDPTEFGMAEELHLWLKDRAAKDGLDWSALTRAEMRVDFECRERPGGKPNVRVRELRFSCAADLDAGEGRGHGAMWSSEVGVKDGDEPWVVH